MGVSRGGNAIMTRQALAPFGVISFHAVPHSHLDPPDLFIPAPHTPLGYLFTGGPLVSRPPPFFSHYSPMCLACSWQRRELCMSLAPTAHTERWS